MQRGTVRYQYCRFFHTQQPPALGPGDISRIESKRVTSEKGRRVNHSHGYSMMGNIRIRIREIALVPRV
jgi:hypothetical protein